MRNITIRARIILLICVSVLFSGLIGGIFLYQMLDLKGFAIQQTQQAMLEGQKEKLKLSVDALALALGEELKGVEAVADKVALIRRATAPILFEADKSGYFFVYEGTVNVAMSVKPENQGKDLGGMVDKNGVYLIRELAKAAAGGGGFVEYVFEKPGKGIQPKLSYAVMIPGSPYWIGTGVYIDNIDEHKAAISDAIGGMVASAVTMVGVVVLALLLLVVLPLSLFIFRSIVHPLTAATRAAEQVAGGDLGVSLEVVGKDETSHLERALNTMVGTLRTNMAAIEAKTREAEDKARAAEEATRQAEEARAQAIRARQEGLLAAAVKLEAVVERLSSASEEISGQADAIGRSTDVQRQRVTETATAMEEMNATVLEVAKNATQASEGADGARSTAVEGNAVVGRSVAAMDALLTLSGELKGNMDTLGRRAQDISQVMNVITDIADQTNLLALNAAIEAARAGDAGRGFAVVADEVRKLAEKTMNATKEVGETVRAVQEVSQKNVQGMEQAARAIAESTELVRQSGASLDAILRMSESTALQVQSIATAAEEQSAASEEINQAVEQINAIAGETAQSMQQTTIAIRELAEQAETLRNLVAELKREGQS
ncbi:methyl-accepting chemotaxis sensory transducer with Cache sensor [Humidesulfovibrio mexicanus]|uniref:Methyl-accepting chemotaxis sensory transducer with Cache sensor n=1 Tax=Humidesulfovibrio mexicanus TaxID=147047 RepID=A0A239B436_9BACT|nr:methyl-accepting chemotaxis protein [Humidesulfovibrio mexicanus]SNS02715.1 methyl-accepting chemotaxis sensory transducer with Cache sensor [Humidesulfovibrio mexicanus]